MIVSMDQSSYIICGSMLDPLPETAVTLCYSIDTYLCTSEKVTINNGISV